MGMFLLSPEYTNIGEEVKILFWKIFKVKMGIILLSPEYTNIGWGVKNFFFNFQSQDGYVSTKSRVH